MTANFTCTTKIFPYQRTNIFGDKGHIAIDTPCNAPLDGPTEITVHAAKSEEILTFEANQYVLQCEAFADAIINNKTVPYPINDAFLNMKVIDAIIKSDLEKSKVTV